MSYARLGPSKTPPVIRGLLFAIACFSVFVGIVSHLFGHWLTLYSPNYLFSLSLVGVKHLFLWQWLTFAFVVPSPLTTFFLIYLAFTLSIIWIVGSAVVQRIGAVPFLRLMGVCTLLSGLAATAALLFAPPLTFLCGAMPVCMALLTAWMLLEPSREIVVLLAVPVRIKWLILGFLGINLLLDIGSGNIASLTAEVIATLSAYFYGLLAWNTHGPFERLRPFDDQIARMGTQVRQFLHRKALFATPESRDLRRRQALDIILEKISKKGMRGLSWRERRLLRRNRR